VTGAFWERVERSGDVDPCWLWRGAVGANGYGALRVHGKQWAAHRFAWELTHGPIPAGFWVLHHCDNPLCVNPAHLYLGRHVDNVRDRDVRGRTLRGERHGSTRVSETLLTEVRAQHAAGVLQHELAKRFGVSTGWVSLVVRGLMRKAAA
jgi:hypothetical protein